MGDELRSMLEKLKKTPADLELRRQAAEALERSTKPGADRTQVDGVLATGFVNVGGHDDDTDLPCLCRDCLGDAGVTAEAAGMKYVRSFVTTGTRVLHFWMLDEVARKRAAVRDSVQVALERRLSRNTRST